MAPPATRRMGFSKKAQYSVFTGYLLAGLGALLGLTLLGLSLWRPTAFAPLRGTASDVTAPAGEATAAVRVESQGFWESIKGYYRAGSKNAQLRREVELTRVRLAEADALAAENERLKKLLGLSTVETQPVAITRLVGSTAASTRRFAYVGVGRDAGLATGMPVTSERGVIGRVLEVSRSSARLMLLTDSESVLPVRRATDDIVAFAEGRGDGLLRIKLINLGINPLKVGDMLVTSGAGGYYRPGLAVGIVTKITPDGALARLVAEPSATNFVVIEPIHQASATKAAQLPDDRPLPEESTETQR